MDALTIQILAIVIASIWLFYLVIKKISDKLYNVQYPNNDGFVEYIDLYGGQNKRIIEVTHSENTYFLEKMEFRSIYENVRESWQEESCDTKTPNPTR